VDFIRNEIENAARDYRKMKILAFDLSSARGSLAWLDQDVDLLWDWPNDRKNSASFFENVGGLKRQFGSPKRIIVGLGPGSYAGTRIAISAATGLQLASRAQLIGFSSICAMEDGETEYCMIGDARRQLFFFARVRHNNLVEGPSLFSETELRDKINNAEKNVPIFCSEELPPFQRAVIRYPSARVLARLAREANRSFVLPPLEPIYLREPHITTMKA
jgi:tRNA threonylcarbamoyl adenosine modification protein YeaZ